MEVKSIHLMRWLGQDPAVSQADLGTHRASGVIKPQPMEGDELAGSCMAITITAPLSWGTQAAQ